MMKHRFNRLTALFLVLILLTSCGISRSTDDSSSSRRASSSAAASAAAEQTKEEATAEDAAVPEAINVAGLELMTHTEYRVYLDPTAYCSPSFTPVCVTMEFMNQNSCLLTYEGKSIRLGRFNNDKYINLFSVDDGDVADAIMINGKCDRNCSDADFAVRVSEYLQGENAVRVFGDNVYVPPVYEEPEPQVPVILKAGRHTITVGETYTFRVVPDESCEKTFDPFTVPIHFYSELAVGIVVSQYKNVSSIDPFVITMEDTGWI